MKLLTWQHHVDSCYQRRYSRTRPSKILYTKMWLVVKNNTAKNNTEGNGLKAVTQ